MVLDLKIDDRGFESAHDSDSDEKIEEITRTNKPVPEGFEHQHMQYTQSEMRNHGLVAMAAIPCLIGDDTLGTLGALIRSTVPPNPKTDAGFPNDLSDTLGMHNMSMTIAPHPIPDDALRALILVHVPPIATTEGWWENLGAPYQMAVNAFLTTYDSKVWNMSADEANLFFKAVASFRYIPNPTLFIPELSSAVWLFMVPKIIYYMTANAAQWAGSTSLGSLGYLLGISAVPAGGLYMLTTGGYLIMEMLASGSKAGAAAVATKAAAGGAANAYVDALQKTKIVFSFFNRFFLGKDASRDDLKTSLLKLLDNSFDDVDAKQYMIDGIVPFLGNGFLCFLMQTLLMRIGVFGVPFKMIKHYFRPKQREKISKQDYIEKTKLMDTMQWFASGTLTLVGLGINILNTISIFQALGEAEVGLDGRVLITLSEISGASGMIALLTGVWINVRDSLSTGTVLQFHPMNIFGSTFWQIFTSDEAWKRMPFRELFGMDVSEDEKKRFMSILRNTWGVLTTPDIVKVKKTANPIDGSIQTNVTYHKDRLPETGRIYRMIGECFLEGEIGKQFREATETKKYTKEQRNMRKQARKVLPYFSYFYYGKWDSDKIIERDVESLTIAMLEGQEWLMSMNMVVTSTTFLTIISAACITYLYRNRKGIMNISKKTLDVMLKSAEILTPLRSEARWWRIGTVAKAWLRHLNMAAETKNRINDILKHQISDFDKHCIELAGKDVAVYQARLRDCARSSLRFDPANFPNTAMQEILDGDSLEGVRKLKEVISRIPTADSMLAEFLKYASVWFRDKMTEIQGMKRNHRTAAAVFGFAVIWATVPVLADVLRKQDIMDILTWLFRGFFATKSSVNIGHLEYLVLGLRAVSKVFGKVKVNNLRLFTKLVRMIDHTTDTGQNLLYGLGTVVMFLLYGAPKDRRILKALRPEDGLGFLSSREPQKMSIMNHIQNGLYDMVHPWTILRLLWRTGPWKVVVFAMLAKLVTGNLGIARDIAILALSPL